MMSPHEYIDNFLHVVDQEDTSGATGNKELDSVEGILPQNTAVNVGETSNDIPLSSTVIMLGNEERTYMDVETETALHSLEPSSDNHSIKPENSGMEPGQSVETNNRLLIPPTWFRYSGDILMPGTGSGSNGVLGNSTTLDSYLHQGPAEQLTYDQPYDNAAIDAKPLPLSYSDGSSLPLELGVETSPEIPIADFNLSSHGIPLGVDMNPNYGLKSYHSPGKLQFPNDGGSRYNQLQNIDARLFPENHEAMSNVGLKDGFGLSVSDQKRSPWNDCFSRGALDYSRGSVGRTRKRGRTSYGDSALSQHKNQRGIEQPAFFESNPDVNAGPPPPDILEPKVGTFDLNAYNQHLQQLPQNFGGDGSFFDVSQGLSLPTPSRVLRSSHINSSNSETALGKERSLAKERLYYPRNSSGGFAKGSVRGGIVEPVVPMKYRSLHEAEQAALAHIPDNFKPNPDDTYPSTTGMEFTYAARIFNSMMDTSQAEDNPGLQQQWHRATEQQSDTIETVSWAVLQRLKDYHDQPGFLRSKFHYPASLKKYRVFEPHVEQVCRALRRNKTICRHFIGTSYVDGTIDDPVAAVNRVRNNRKVNKDKKAKLEGLRNVQKQFDEPDRSSVVSVEVETDERPKKRARNEAKGELEPLTPLP